MQTLNSIQYIAVLAWGVQVPHCTPLATPLVVILPSLCQGSSINDVMQFQTAQEPGPLSPIITLVITKALLLTSRNFRQFSTLAPSPYHYAFYYKGLSTVVTKTLTPPPDVINGRPLMTVASLFTKVFHKNKVQCEKLFVKYILLNRSLFSPVLCCPVWTWLVEYDRAWVFLLLVVVHDKMMI